MKPDPETILLEESSALLEDGLGLEGLVRRGVVIVLGADLAGRRIHQFLLSGHLFGGKLFSDVRSLFNDLSQLREGACMLLLHFLDVPEMYLIVESMIDGLLEAALDAVERLQLEDVLSAFRWVELISLAVHDSPK